MRSGVRISSGPHIGFTRDRARRQWAATWLLAAVTGKSIESIAVDVFEATRDDLLKETERLCSVRRAERLGMYLHQAGAVLYHLGFLNRLPKPRGIDRAEWRKVRWQAVPDELAATIQRYLEQLAAVQRPATVAQVEGALREFALFITGETPRVKNLRDIERRHIESYKSWLASRLALGVTN